MQHITHVIRGKTPADFAVSKCCLDQRRGIIWQPVLALAARGLVLPVSAIATLATGRSIVTKLGVDGYAIVALIATLPALLPFTDFGVGAAIVHAVANRERSDPGNLYRVLVTSIRVLTTAGTAIISLSVLLAVTNEWSIIIGVHGRPGTNWAVTLCFSLFGLSLPCSIGNALLLGSGRNYLAILLTGMSSLISLAVVLAGGALSAPLWWFASASSFAALAIGMTSLWLGSAVAGVDLTKLIRDARRKSVRGARIRHLAGPMAIISASLPVAYQSDRLILSHVSSLGELAMYAVGAQLYAPFLSLISSAGQSLWPLFLQRRSVASTRANLTELRLAVLLFSTIGVCMAVILVRSAPPIAHWATHSRIYPSPNLMLAFAILLLVHASYYPAGMFMTDSLGLRFQAVTSVSMASVNVPLSVGLSRYLGASGPVVGSTIAIFLCMWLPGFIRFWRMETNVQRSESHR